MLGFLNITPSEITVRNHRQKLLAGSSHILTKFMDAQRRTALIFVTQGVGCASCIRVTAPKKTLSVLWIHISGLSNSSVRETFCPDLSICHV